VPLWNTNLQLFNPCADHIPSNSLRPAFRNFTYLLIIDLVMSAVLSFVSGQQDTMMMIMMMMMMMNIRLYYILLYYIITYYISLS